MDGRESTHQPWRVMHFLMKSSKFPITAATGRRGEVQRYDRELGARLYLMSYLTGLRRLELANPTPRSSTFDADQPILQVHTGCSKHHREATLPLHPELVVMARGWIAGMDADQPLFPGSIARRPG